MFISIIKDNRFNSVATRTLCIIYTLIDHIFNVIGIIGAMPMEVGCIRRSHAMPIVPELIKTWAVGIGKVINGIIPVFLIDRVTVHDRRIPMTFTGKEDMR